MSNDAIHYTHTTWRVKEGNEEEFVRRWNEWAEWSRRQGLVEIPLLLRDTEDPRRFVSFGPWESVSAIVGWRALPGYQERVERLRRVVDGFEPQTFEIVPPPETIGDPHPTGVEALHGPF